MEFLNSASWSNVVPRFQLSCRDFPRSNLLESLTTEGSKGIPKKFSWIPNKFQGITIDPQWITKEFQVIFPITVEFPWDSSQFILNFLELIGDSLEFFGILLNFIDFFSETSKSMTPRHVPCQEYYDLCKRNYIFIICRNYIVYWRKSKATI